MDVKGFGETLVWRYKRAMSVNTSASGASPAKAARRREILDVAFAEFSARGYERASMAEIARRARASKETLYAWFSDKETLFATVLAARMEATVSTVGALAGSDPPPQVLLPIVAENVLRLGIALGPLIQAFSAGDPSEKTLHMLGKRILAERSRFVAYLLDCRERGFIAFDDDPFELVSAFVAMAAGEWGLRLATGITPRLTDKMIAEHARRVTRLFLRSLAP